MRTIAATIRAITTIATITMTMGVSLRLTPRDRRALRGWITRTRPRQPRSGWRRQGPGTGGAMPSAVSRCGLAAIVAAIAIALPASVAGAASAPGAPGQRTT